MWPATFVERVVLGGDVALSHLHARGWWLRLNARRWWCWPGLGGDMALSHLNARGWWWWLGCVKGRVPLVFACERLVVAGLDVACERGCGILV